MEWLLIPYMAILSRMSGGMPPRLPLGLDQWLYSLPYLMLTMSCGYVPAAIAYLCAVIGKRQANRQYMDLGHWKGEDRKKHRYDVVLKILEGEIPQYWYEFVGIGLVGLAVTLVPGIIIGWSNPLFCLVLLLSGFGKSLAYAIGWKIYPHGEGKGIPYLNEATAIGEILTGVFAAIGVIICL